MPVAGTYKCCAGHLTDSLRAPRSARPGKENQDRSPGEARDVGIEIDIPLRITCIAGDMVDSEDLSVHLLRPRIVNQAFTAWTSSVRVTSSPTRNPPVSRVVFHVNPKSFLLIFVVADMPIRVLPHGSVAGA